MAEAAGAQTQLTGVVGALFAVALILLLAPTLLQTFALCRLGRRRHRLSYRIV